MLKNAFILFAVAFAILWIFVPVFSKWQDLKQKDRDYQLQVKTLEEENQRLLEEKRLLEEDPAYLEKVAREKMGLIREGEVIYHITPVNATGE
ncbi:MAG TPA: septum formation initiator family protein [Candidatus Omnitrophota bacterium]|nr:septum formation initiator family protein [Candidatus Omnitrophota bacterium]